VIPCFSFRSPGSALRPCSGRPESRWGRDRGAAFRIGLAPPPAGRAAISRRNSSRLRLSIWTDPEFWGTDT